METILSMTRSIPAPASTARRFSQRRIHVGVAIEGLHTRQNLPVVAAVDQHLRKKTGKIEGNALRKWSKMKV